MDATGDGGRHVPLDLEAIKQRIAIDDEWSQHDDTWALITKGEGRALLAEVSRLRAARDIQLNGKETNDLTRVDKGTLLAGTGSTASTD